MFQIKNIATHNFLNGNTTLDGAAQKFVNLNIYVKYIYKVSCFRSKEIKNIGTHKFQNGNTWIVRSQINFTRYVCESTNIYNLFGKPV